jgi:hypothetical protein
MVKPVLTVSWTKGRLRVCANLVKGFIRVHWWGFRGDDPGWPWFDRCLTGLTRLIRSLTLMTVIKNLGRHRKCATSAECKTDRSAVLTVKSGLDPHMINEVKDGFNIAFRLFLWPCWVPTISVLILAYPVQRRTQSGVLHRLRGVLRMRSTSQMPVEDEDGSRVFIVIVARVKTFVSTLVSVIKINKPFLYVLSIVLWYYTHESIICVKLWFWHTYEMHLVLFGKTGVTWGGWVSRRQVTKTLWFWQKRSLNCDFHGRSTFSVIMQPYGWVWREG